MAETLEIDGRTWRIGRRHAAGSWPLLPVEPLPGTGREGGVLSDDSYWAVLPDGVTTARQRTGTLVSYGLLVARSLGLLRIGAANVWTLDQSWSTSEDTYEPWRVVTAPAQLAVLRALQPAGHWRCYDKLIDAGAGYRFGGRIHELRVEGYPIDKRPCPHKSHRTRQWQYRLPGLQSPGTG